MINFSSSFRVVEPTSQCVHLHGDDSSSPRTIQLCCIVEKKCRKAIMHDGHHERMVYPCVEARIICAHRQKVQEITKEQTDDLAMASKAGNLDEVVKWLDLEQREQDTADCDVYVVAIPLGKSGTAKDTTMFGGGSVAGQREPLIEMPVGRWLHIGCANGGLVYSTVQLPSAQVVLWNNHAQMKHKVDWLAHCSSTNGDYFLLHFLHALLLRLVFKFTLSIKKASEPTFEQEISSIRGVVGSICELQINTLAFLMPELQCNFNLSPSSCALYDASQSQTYFILPAEKGGVVIRSNLNGMCVAKVARSILHTACLENKDIAVPKTMTQLYTMLVLVFIRKHLIQDSKFILVEGSPGIGKSTLAWELCRKWDTLESLQDVLQILFRKQGRSPLHFGHPAKKILHEFLPHTDWFNAGKSLVHIACKEGNVNLVKSLLFEFETDGWGKVKEDLHLLGLNGTALLHSACIGGNIASDSIYLLHTTCWGQEKLIKLTEEATENCSQLYLLCWRRKALSLELARERFQCSDEDKLKLYFIGIHNALVKDTEWKERLITANANILDSTTYYFIQKFTTHENFNMMPISNNKKTCLLDIVFAYQDYFTIKIIEKLKILENLLLSDIQICTLCGNSEIIKFFKMIKINMQEDDEPDLEQILNFLLNDEGYSIDALFVPEKHTASGTNFPLLSLCIKSTEVLINQDIFDVAEEELIQQDLFVMVEELFQQDVLLCEFAASNSACCKMEQDMPSDCSFIPLRKVWRQWCDVIEISKEICPTPSKNCNNLKIIQVYSFGTMGSEKCNGGVRGPLQIYAYVAIGHIHFKEIIGLNFKNEVKAFGSCEKADHGNHRIQVLKEPFGWSIDPQQIACDSSGSVYVVDTIDHIQVFMSMGKQTTLEKNLHTTELYQKLAEFKTLWQLLLRNTVWEKVMKAVQNFGHCIDNYFLTYLLDDPSHNDFIKFIKFIDLITKEKWISEDSTISYRKPELISSYFAYEPPEILNVDNSRSKGDCWTLGVVVFQILATFDAAAEDSSLSQIDTITHQNLKNENIKLWRKDGHIAYPNFKSACCISRMLCEASINDTSLIYGLNESFPLILVNGSFGIGKTRLLALTNFIEIQGDCISSDQDTIEKAKSSGISTCVSEYSKKREQILTSYKSIVSHVRDNFYDSHRITRVFVIGTPGTGKSSFNESMKKDKVSKFHQLSHTANINHLNTYYSVYDSYAITTVLVLGTPKTEKSLLIKSLTEEFSCEMSEPRKIFHTTNIFPSVHFSSHCNDSDRITRVRIIDTPGSRKSSLFESLKRKFSESCKLTHTASIFPSVSVSSHYDICDLSCITTALVIGTSGSGKSSLIESLKRKFRAASINRSVSLSSRYDICDSSRITRVLVRGSNGTGKSSLVESLKRELPEPCTPIISPIVRVIVIGSTGTGKSSLVESLKTELPEFCAASIIPCVNLSSGYDIYESSHITRVLFIGSTGTGKSSLVESLKTELPEFCAASIIPCVNLSSGYDIYESSHITRVLFIGSTGTGKSSLVESLKTKLPESCTAGIILSVVCGSTGTGKSSLVEALKRELPVFYASSISRITGGLVIGSTGTGKSSLIESLKRELSCKLCLTADIIRTIYLNSCDIIYDFAGDTEYYSSHAAIIAHFRRLDTLFAELREYERAETKLHSTCSTSLYTQLYEQCALDYKKVSLLTVTPKVIAHLLLLGKVGIGKGQFRRPSGVATDSTERVYVADYGNHRIQVFTAEGRFLRMFRDFSSGRGGLREPWGVRLLVYTDAEAHEHYTNEELANQVPSLQSLQNLYSDLRNALLNDGIFAGRLPGHITQDCFIHFQYCLLISSGILKETGLLHQPLVILLALCFVDESQALWDDISSVDLLSLCSCLSQCFLHAFFLKLVSRFNFTRACLDHLSFDRTVVNTTNKPVIATISASNLSSDLCAFLDLARINVNVIIRLAEFVSSLRADDKMLDKSSMKSFSLSCGKWDSLKSLQMMLLVTIRESRVQNATSSHRLIFYPNDELCKGVVDLISNLCHDRFQKHLDCDLKSGNSCLVNIASHHFSFHDQCVCGTTEDQKELMKSLKEVIFGILQLTFICFQINIIYVATNVCRLALFLSLLLLLAGDVETNPGPTDSNTKAELSDVVTIPNVEMKWKDLGLALRLSTKQLTEIEAKYKKPIRCKREMFRLAVKSHVTWREIIIGLCNIGMRSNVKEVCAMFDISLNGLSAYVNSSGQTSETVEPDGAESVTSSTSGAVEQKSPSKEAVEIGTFKSVSAMLANEVSRDPIMLANAVYSRGIITQDNLHQLRVISSKATIVSRLIKMIEGTIFQYPFKFEAFVEALRSISSHANLAGKISRIHRLNLVGHKIKKVSLKEVDLNHLSAELNNLQLISDDTRTRAARAANATDMCSVLLSELQTKELADQFLNLLGSYPNTKIISDMLRPMYRSSTDSDSGVTSQSISSQSFELQSKSHSPRKPKTVETQFTSRNSPTMATTDVIMAKGSVSASARHSSSTAQVSESVMQDVRSAESNSDAYLSAEGNSREFPMQRLDSVVLPQAGSEIAGKGTGTLNPVAKKFTSESKDYEAVVPRQKLPQTTQQVYDPVLPKPKSSLSTVVPTAEPKVTKQEADEFFSVLMKWDAAQVDARLKKNIALANYEYKNKRTPLMLAAVEGSKDVVKVLLNYKPSLTAVDSEGYNPLFLAATNGNYEVVKMLVEQPNPQLHVKNYRGVPLLVEPARKGFSMITDLLIQHGAKVNEESPDGETALYVACRKGHLDVVKVLLASNADVSKECKKTQLTPLEEAVQGDNSDIVRLLMKAVASIKKKSQELFTSTNPDTIKSLISNGAKIDTRNNEEATPLIVHTKLTHLEIVKELIDLRANVDLQDVRGYSALIYAAKGGSWEIVQILVARGAILDLKEKEYGFTALMFAITNKRPRIVKELVLAKANVAIRNLDNKSSLDLARESGHPEILEVMELTPTLSSGKDPFLNILSSYMAEKGKEKRSEPSRPSKRPSPTSKAVVAATHPLVPEENTAHVVEVKKLQRRIADLETRIHDLTIMGAMEIADDNDLTYMERSRLESEFKKLKESKKKAEQYSIEAKQTAQRLSAENFKLREDLSKERHMNELSRKNMMREVEMNVERQAVQSKMEAIRKEVFESEVEKMATRRMAEVGSVAKRVEISEEAIREVVLKSDIDVEMFHLIVSGLPESGRSAIVKSVFKPNRMKTNTGLSLYEVIILRNKTGSIHHWIEGEKVQSMVHAVALGFSRCMKELRHLPILGSTQKTLKIFDDSEAQETFELAYKQLQDLLYKLENEERIANLLTGTMSLVNVYDFKNSKGATEFDKAVGGRNSHLLKINVLDLSKHGKDEIIMKSDIKEDQLSMHPGKTVLHQVVSRIESLSMYKSPSVVVVGTHEDEIQDTFKKQSKEVMELISHCCDEMGVPHETYLPEMITVNATDEKSCEPLRTAIIQLIEANKQKFNIRIPVRFILLRYVLFSTSKMYMSRKELISYAKKCKCKEDEVERFLEIFRKCASIISSSVEGEFLYNYVILLPIEFFHHLDKLYNVMDDKVLPPDLKKPAAFGIVQEEVVRSIWQGTVDSTIPNHEFFVSALKNVRLIMEVGNKYFVPSLRTKLDSEPASPGSLVISITSNVSLTPFSGKQYMFVTELLRLHNTKDTKLHDTRLHDIELHEEIVLDEECPHYNVICLIWKQAEGEARIRIRFFTDSIDVTISPVKAKNFSKSFSINLHSILKTDCVSIMNQISDRRQLYQDQEYLYRFSIVCPNKHNHLIPFDIGEATVESLTCPQCSYECHGDADLLWVKSAYRGSHRSALNKDDVINPKNLLAVSESLSSLNIREIELLNKELNHEKLNSPSSDANEALFHVLYMWYCRNPNVTRRKLAKVLQECNFHKQALSLDPTLLSQMDANTADNASLATNFSTLEVTYIAESWTQTTEELAAVLSVHGQETKYGIIDAWLQEQKGDKRKSLAKTFEKSYPNFANLISDLHLLL